KSEISDILKKHGYNPSDICKLSFGESKIKFLNEIIAGGLSADLMDYLSRDGLFTGVEYGKIDHHRLISSFEVVSNGHLAIDRSALYSFESMLISRYEMFKAVYFHKTVRSAEVMLLEAMLLADNELQLTTSDLKKYVLLTDEFVISKLVSLPQKNSELKRARQLAIDYQERKLLKCVYEKIFTHPRMGKVNASVLQSEIAKKSKVDEAEIFVDISKTPSIPLSPTKKES